MQHSEMVQISMPDRSSRCQRYRYCCRRMVCCVVVPAETDREEDYKENLTNRQEIERRTNLGMVGVGRTRSISDR
jgi:hypothetical protein